jgi:hypothetical protein
VQIDLQTEDFLAEGLPGEGRVGVHDVPGRSVGDPPEAILVCATCQSEGDESATGIVLPSWPKPETLQILMEPFQAQADAPVPLPVGT